MSAEFDAARLAALHVLHWPKPPTGALPPLPAADGLVVDTCLRQLFVTPDHALADALASPHAECYSGVDAYAFLLEVATGLRSAVPGETNVFGQVKRGWERCRVEATAATVATLGPIVAQLVADTRSIRHAHLQDIGGASYGTLARKLLDLAGRERLLIVGAGDLARSLLPYFRDRELGLWNRHKPGPAFAAAARLFAPADGSVAARWADAVVMTTPADAAHDGQWRDWLAGSHVHSVLHLGRRRHERLQWPGAIRALDLDDVFALRQSQDNIRSLQLERARAACSEITAARAAGVQVQASRLAAR